MVQEITAWFGYWLRRLRVTIENSFKTSPRASDRTFTSKEIWDAFSQNLCPNCDRKDTMFFDPRRGRDRVCSKCDFSLLSCSMKPLSEELE
jgi:hypothetical protein